MEKYRPVTLDDVVSHKDITSTSKFWTWTVHPCHSIILNSWEIHWEEPLTTSALLWTSWYRKDVYYPCCCQTDIWQWISKANSRGEHHLCRVLVQRSDLALLVKCVWWTRYRCCPRTNQAICGDANALFQGIQANHSRWGGYDDPAGASSSSKGHWTIYQECSLLHHLQLCQQDHPSHSKSMHSVQILSSTDLWGRETISDRCWCRKVIMFLLTPEGY